MDKDDTAPTITAVMMTDVGVVREHNEDSAYIDPAHRFFIVADGMGGHAAGEVASSMAVESVRLTLEAANDRIVNFSKDPSEETRREIAQLMQDAVLAAHQAVFQRGNRETDKQGMGTTLDILLIAGAEAFVAHVGDSRTYLLREGRISQITTDHTVAQVAVIEGRISEEEALMSNWRNILVNAIGVSADVGVEMAHIHLTQGDRLLICSDGLHDYFTLDTEVASHLMVGDLQTQLSHMIELAKDRGGHDNITGIVVEIMSLVSNGVPGEMPVDPTRPITAKHASLLESSERAVASTEPPPIGDEDTETVVAPAK